MRYFKNGSLAVFADETLFLPQARKKTRNPVL
jgi:hypothetical protein